VSTGSRSRRRQDSAATLVDDLSRQVTALSRDVREPAPERQKTRQINELSEATLLLAGAPALSIDEVAAKLAILCGRLREDLHPEVQGELVTYLLAESIREDCRILSCCDGGARPPNRR
jgi:hypothetical protein